MDPGHSESIITMYSIINLSSSLFPLMASPRNMKAKRDKVKMEEENIRRFFLSFSLSLSLRSISWNRYKRSPTPVREAKGCHRFCSQMKSYQIEKMPARRTRSLCTEKLPDENGTDPIKAKISWSKSNEEHSIDIDPIIRYKYPTSWW